MTESSIKSAERTIALFELFSATEAPLSVGQISRALQMPQSSTTMLLRSLNNIGYLEYDPATRKYQPTIRILLLGSWVARRFSETGKIAAALDALQAVTGETVVMGLQHNAKMQAILTRGGDRTGLHYVVPAYPNSEERILIRSGMFASLTCSAMGRAVLSLKPDAEISTWLRRANAETEDPQFRISEREFEPIIAKVRRDGYAETVGAHVPGLGALAIAIPSPMGSPPLTISVSMRLERIPLKKDLVLRELFKFRSAIPTDHASTVAEEEEWLLLPA